MICNKVWWFWIEENENVKTMTTDAIQILISKAVVSLLA
jgi:hypothetical protein